MAPKLAADRKSRARMCGLQSQSPIVYNTNAPVDRIVLLGGEEERHANEEVVYKCHYRGSQKGTLYLTNFRMIFMVCYIAIYTWAAAELLLWPPLGSQGIVPRVSSRAVA